jgi:hypothetical protein
MIKKVFFISFTLALLSSFCFAEQQVTSSTTMATKILLGHVASVSLADPVKGTKSEIAVNDLKGQKINFAITSSTGIYDATMKSITLDKISNNASVQVKYITNKDGVNEATSIVKDYPIPATAK